MISLVLLLACAGRAPVPTAPLRPPPPSLEPAVSESSSPPLSSADLAKAFDFDDPAGTEARYRELLPRAVAVGPDLELELWTRLARTHGLRGDFAAGHAVLDTVQARLAEASDTAGVHVRLPLERGRLHNSAGDKQTALGFFARARDEAGRVGDDVLWLDAVHMQGIAADPDAALAFNMEAIAFAENSDDDKARGWLGPLYNNTGWTYMDRGEPDQALPLFEKGVTFRAQAGAPVPLRIAKYTVGAALRKLDRCEEALPIQRALAEEWAAEGKVGGYVEEELGECLLALGRAEEARPHFAAAHAELSKDGWMVDNEADRLARLKELAGE
ncbi:MAG: hypothetical protein H6742_16935 [Alphaproteobacteria bacterium]|nr:hypothetical protein [Alphaproteobacteria bacterium]